MITTEQKTNRRNGIYGSDAAVICGKSRFKTRMQLWLEKTGAIEPDDISEKMHVKAGNYLEESLIKWFADEKDVFDFHSSLNTFTSEKHDFMKGHVDALVSTTDRSGYNAILEIKTTSLFNKHLFGEEGENLVPSEYLLQAAHYMAVTDLSKAYIAVLIGGNDFRIFEFDRNLALEEKLIAKEKEFWEYNIRQGIPPDPETKEDVIALYPQSTSKIVTASDELENFVTDLRMIKQQKKELEAQEKALQTLICKQMKEGDELQDCMGKTLLTWKSTNFVRRIDKDLLEASFPDVFQEVYKEFPGHRVFKLKGE